MGVRAAGYCHHHRLPTRESPYGFPQSPADSTGLPSRAPVFNDEEKRAGATTQVDKVAREGYCFYVAVWHFGQGVTGRPPCSLGLGMLGLRRFPHGMCQLSHKRFAPSCGAPGPVVVGQVGRWLEASETAEGRAGAQFVKQSPHAATTALQHWRTLKVTDPAAPMRAIGSRRFESRRFSIARPLAASAQRYPADAVRCVNAGDVAPSTRCRN